MMLNARVLKAAALIFFLLQASASADWLLPRYNSRLNPVVANAIHHFQWKFPIPGGAMTSPVVDGDNVYVAGKNDQIYALHLYTGTLEWTEDTGNEALPAPLVDHGIIIASAGNLEKGNKGVLGTGVSSVVGLDAATGRQVWWYGLDGTGASGGAIIDGRYVHHDGAGNVVALDPRNGIQYWKKKITTHAALSAITPIGNAAFVTSGSNPNEVIALSSRTGKLLWRKEFPKRFLGFGDVPLAADEHNVYGAYFTRSSGSTFVEHALALDLKTGRLHWNVALQAGTLQQGTPLSTIPLVDGTRVYLGNPLAPYMNAIAISTGKIEWSSQISAPSAGGSVLKDHVLYFGDNAGDLWALATESGKPLGYVGMGDPFDRSAPTIAGETLLITSRDGYAIAEPLEYIRSGMDAANR